MRTPSQLFRYDSQALLRYKSISRSSTGRLDPYASGKPPLTKGGLSARMGLLFMQALPAAARPSIVARTNSGGMRLLSCREAVAKASSICCVSRPPMIRPEKAAGLSRGGDKSLAVLTQMAAVSTRCSHGHSNAIVEYITLEHGL
jgi:hypothetical protein